MVWRTALSRIERDIGVVEDTGWRSVDVWSACCCLNARIAPRFARPEPRRRALAYLQAILSDISRKNGWRIAEYARETRPDGMQRLLASSVWDADLVRDDTRVYVLEKIGAPGGILVIDETSFPKQGKKSAPTGYATRLQQAGGDAERGVS